MEVEVVPSVLEGRKRRSSERSLIGQVTVVATALTLIVALVLLLGCELPVTYTDISDHPDFEWLVGRRCRLVEAMQISGVNLPPGYGEEIQVYLIDPASHRWSGREVITRDILEVGTVLTVQRVVKCCLGEKEAVVTIDPYEVAANVPSMIDLDSLIDSCVEITD